MFQLLNDSICLGLRYSQHLYNFISFNKQTFSHVLNLLNRDKVSSPFTDSEFQRGKIQPVSKNFRKNFWFAPRFMVFQRIRRITVKKARKFVLRKTNLRALRDFGIILYPDSGGINLVSTSDFRWFLQIVRAENPCNIKVFSTTGQPLWVTPTRSQKPWPKRFCIDRLAPIIGIA